jgi:hypothetical protein
MPSDGTIGGLVGKLPVLRIECPMCGRRGRYYVARLVAEFGPSYRLTDWLHERTADCPQKSPAAQREDVAPSCLIWWVYRKWVANLRIGLRSNIS